MTPVLSRTEKRMLADVKQKLRRMLGKRLVRLDLFGSRAHGDARPDSDIDLAIVVNGLNRTLREAIYRALFSIEVKYNRSPSTILFSRQDFDRLLKRERRIAWDILNEGVAL